MEAFKTICSVMAYLPIANIDTDMIIPKQYLKTIKRTGLGTHLFAELRYDENNQSKPDFILNQAPFEKASILVTEENFGCGSSREHAVWSLMDFGIKAIMAPSFADIFYSNCFKNGLLPLMIPRQTIHILCQHPLQFLTVNLELQTIRLGEKEFSFTIAPDRRDMLLQGLDEIGETLIHEHDIALFETKHNHIQPWLFERY